jgi:hypothetical protein
VAVFHFRIELIDADAGRLFVRVVAARAVLLEEWFHVTVECGLKRVGGPNWFGYEERKGDESE